jgi:hAT family C-terminal dimerisation region
METAGLMTITQYKFAEHDLIGRLQGMQEREVGHLIVADQSSEDEVDEECLDDPVVRTLSTERERVLEEYRVYCNVCKKQRNRPRSYVGETLKLGVNNMKHAIEMGMVGTRGDDIRAHPPFVPCNLADFIGDDGRFDLVGFLHLQKDCFPTLYKLAMCISSVRTNEVGCERFFSMAGYVSCPRRTSLNVRNYECLSALRSNMQHVYIDERWVVDQYMLMEKTKAWNELDSANDMRVLDLERELLAENMGVSPDCLPPINQWQSLLYRWLPWSCLNRMERTINLQLMTYGLDYSGQLTHLHHLRKVW